MRAFIAVPLWILLVVVLGPVGVLISLLFSGSLEDWLKKRQQARGESLLAEAWPVLEAASKNVVPVVNGGEEEGKTGETVKQE